jgi:hypothetical protein
MVHKNFHQFKAKDNFELGLLMGQQFAELTKLTVDRSSVWQDWKTKGERAKKFLRFNQEHFPEYVEEIHGYAKGAGVDFLDLYTLSLEDEVNQDYPENRCSTLITNNGGLIAHNEDWDKGSEDKICIVEKEIRGLKILELYYYNTLGGNSVSINSNGFVSCINSLSSKDTSVGLSKNVIARWLSETKDPEGDFKKLQELPRSLGYSGNIVKNGKIWNIEYNSKSAVLTHPSAPFVHTNHYLTVLSSSEANTNVNGTFNRYRIGTEKVKDKMSIEEIEKLTNDKTDGDVLSLMNERTIAKIIIDANNKVAKIWLLREPELGWVDYLLP